MARARSGSSRKKAPECGYTLDDVVCSERGNHFCIPRADHAQKFAEEICVHTKDRWARRPFILAPWQRDDIVRPLFGRIRWDTEAKCYVRAYTMAWIELARKNGKSELLAFIALYLLVADGVESAEIYGCAKDTKQARKVFDVAMRMVQLSPVLSRRLTIKEHALKIIDEKTASVYEVITSDAAGELGHNPSGIILDEALTQPSGGLWNALRTAMGARLNTLMVAATTAGNDPASFAAVEHAECERIADDPARAPHRFVYIRNTPKDADPWDESTWAHANPALGDFLSLQALRDEALEARNDPAKENAFRQFRLNQWVQQTTRWMPLHLWDATPNIQTVDESALVGHRCFGGLDLSSKIDLTAAAYVFPDDGMRVVWRFWVPEIQIPLLDQYNAGMASVWVKQGWLTATEGDVIDYELIHDTLAKDARRFKLIDLSHDRWLAEPTVQELNRRKITTYAVGQGYLGMSEPMKELMRLVKSAQLVHGGNPVARWHADSVEAKQDDAENIKPVKPDRAKTGKRIDGMVALIMAIDGWMRRGQKRQKKAAGF